ncbi:MAG: hypothetical protein IPL12_13375 [Bacteroidetes bacterium]|nr:hypothetical protein [Bacteroidota bacterium]
MNQYKVLTVTHKHVPVEQLKHYIIDSDKSSPVLAEKLRFIKQNMQLDELMYLNTCNRVTYFFTTYQTINNSFTANFFKNVNPGFEACNAVNTNLFEGPQAFEHLCEVSASLDSMVVGEREIIRQLRVAYEESNEMHLTGDDIRLAMKMLIPAAKKIFGNKIAEKPVSVVSLAALQLKKFALPAHAKFILIGAGETITNMSAYLIDMGFHNFTVFNRTLANAEKLASNIKGTPYSLSELPNYTGGFDVIITSTGSAKKEITTAIYKNLIGNDNSKKVIIDLAIPLDTEEEIITNFNVEYIKIDNLRSIAQKNLSSRKAEVIKAKHLVHEFVKEFQAAYVERMVEKAHSIIPLKLNEIRRKAVDEVYAKEMATLDNHAKEVVDKLLDYMEKKYLALTMASSKEASRHKH